MKIVLTGGGTGGHFYPLIAVAEELNKLSDEERLADVSLFYFSDSPYDERALFENQITFKRVGAGKRRITGGIGSKLRNFFDLFRTGIGIINAIIALYSVYPDVVFGKGGYASFPTLFAARFLRIPTVIHESDVIPGRVNLWAKGFAKKIGIAYPESETYFPKEKTALVGIPIRKLLLTTSHKDVAENYLGLEQNIPAILILGGSSGAQRVNQAVIDALIDLVPNFQIIHQTGKNNISDCVNLAQVILEKSPFKSRYKPYPFLTEAGLKEAAGVARVVITRAGSTTIFETANWGIPAIVIPIPESVSRDQTQNALAYSSTGAATLMEERNLSPHLLVAEIGRITGNDRLWQTMSQAAKAFARPDSAQVMSEEILKIALSHEQ